MGDFYVRQKRASAQLIKDPLLLQVTDNESQLASMLAHEISHVTKRNAPLTWVGTRLHFAGYNQPDCRHSSAQRYRRRYPANGSSVLARSKNRRPIASACRCWSAPGLIHRDARLPARAFRSIALHLQG